MLVLFGLTFLIFISYSLFLTKRYNTSVVYLDRFLGAFILTCCQILATEVILGWLGIIYRWTLITLNFLVLLIIIWFSRPIIVNGKVFLMDCFGSLKNGWNLWIRYPLIGFMTLWVLILTLYHTFLAYLLPETAWDSLRYHLPIVAQIIQNHHFGNVPTDTIFINTYPKNFELFFLWLIIIPGNDQIVNGGQIPFFLITILAIYRLARLSGFSRGNSWFGALLFSGVPVVLQQLTVSLVDVINACFNILSILWFYRYLLAGGKINLLLSGMSLGIAVGGKINNLILALVLVLSFVILNWRRIGKDKICHFVNSIGYFLIPIFLFSFYWYAKNWYYYKNPIVPYSLSIGKYEIFRGEKDSYQYLVEEKIPTVAKSLNSFERIWKAWHDETLQFSFFGAMHGLGSLWFIIMLPAIVIGFIISVLEQKEYMWWLYIAFLVPFFLFLKYQSITRYGISVIGLGIVAFIMILELLKLYLHLRRALSFFTFLLFLISSTYGSWHKYGYPAKIKELLKLSPRERDVSTCYTYLGLPQGSPKLFHWWRNQETSGSRLMYHCNNEIFTYPLWNYNFSNRVDYVPEVASSDAWRENVKSTDWLLVSKGSKEEFWTKEIENFSLAFEDEFFAVYKRNS